MSRRSRSEESAPRFPGSRDAFQMLRRLVVHGTLRNFNDVIATELIDGGMASREHDELIATERGREASRTLSMPRVDS